MSDFEVLIGLFIVFASYICYRLHLRNKKMDTNRVPKSSVLYSKLMILLDGPIRKALLEKLLALGNVPSDPQELYAAVARRNRPAMKKLKRFLNKPDKRIDLGELDISSISSFMMLFGPKDFPPAIKRAVDLRNRIVHKPSSLLGEKEFKDLWLDGEEALRSLGFYDDELLKQIKNMNLKTDVNEKINVSFHKYSPAGAQFSIPVSFTAFEIINAVYVDGSGQKMDAEIRRIVNDLPKNARLIEVSECHAKSYKIQMTLSDRVKNLVLESDWIDAREILISEAVPKHIMKVSQRWRDKAGKFIEKCHSISIRNNAYSSIFEKEFRLGKGDFGTVYLGYKFRTEDWVAIKRYSSDEPLEHPNEVLIQGKINASNSNSNSKNVAFFYDWFTENYYHYLIFELCDYTLDEYLKDPRELSQMNAITKQFLKGLSFLHSKKVAHRDLKPTNIMTKLFNGELILKICDYGVSKYFENDDELNSKTATKYGNYYWRPPKESFKKKFLFLNDIFVASMLIAYILTNGEHPFLENQNDDELSELPWRKNKYWLNEQLKIRENVKLDHYVRLLIEEIMHFYQNVLKSRHVGQLPIRTIENIRKDYDQKYFAKCPEYTQGDRFLINIRHDLQTTIVRLAEDNPTEAAKLLPNAFQGATDVIAYTSALEECQFKEERGDITRNDPSQEGLAYHFRHLKNCCANPEKPIYVFVNILAHGNSAIDNNIDVSLHIPSQKKKNERKIFLTELLHQLQNELASLARIIVLCNTCREKDDKLKSDAEFPDHVLVVYSVKDGEEDESSDSFDSTYPSSFCEMLVEYMKPGKRISDMLRAVDLKNYEYFCNDESLKDFIF